MEKRVPLGASALQVPASAASSCLVLELSSSAWRLTHWCGCTLRAPYWTDGQTRRRQLVWPLQHPSQMMPPLKPLQNPISMKRFSLIEHQQQDQGGSSMVCSSFCIVLLLSPAPVSAAPGVRKPDARDNCSILHQPTCWDFWQGLHCTSIIHLSLTSHGLTSMNVSS